MSPTGAPRCQVHDLADRWKQTWHAPGFPDAPSRGGYGGSVFSVFLTVPFCVGYKKKRKVRNRSFPFCLVLKMKVKQATTIWGCLVWDEAMWCVLSWELNPPRQLVSFLVSLSIRWQKGWNRVPSLEETHPGGSPIFGFWILAKNRSLWKTKWLGSELANPRVQLRC